MKDKKQSTLHNALGATRFVASAPIDEMSVHLADLSSIKSRVILNLNHRTDYRIQLRDTPFSKPIFLSMTQWNQDETLISLSYYSPSWIKILATLFLIALLILSILVYSPLLFVIIWIVFIGVAISNRANGIGRFEVYKFDENKRNQDDIMDIVIDGFKQSVELNIIS